LHAEGIESVLLTGDNAATARSVGARVQVGAVRAELLPDAKAEAVRATIATVRTTPPSARIVYWSANPVASGQGGLSSGS
jgi:magnesium-transporting ATPase (P-type)